MLWPDLEMQVLGPIRIYPALCRNSCRNLGRQARGRQEMSSDDVVAITFIDCDSRLEVAANVIDLRI